MSPDSATSVRIVSSVTPVPFSEEWYEAATTDHFWLIWRHEALLKMLRRFGVPLEQPLRALDVGGGRGTFCKQMEESSAWTVDLADLDLNALNSAPKGRGEKILYNILEENPQFLGRYDVVFLCDVLEHVDPTEPFIHAVSRHLKPGGLLVLNVPAISAFYSAYDKAVGHVRRYSPKSLVAELSQAPGMRVLAVPYWGFVLLPILALRTALLALKGSRENIVRSGFVPPAPWINRLFLRAMRLELRLLNGRAPLGTSLLLLARRDS